MWKKHKPMAMNKNIPFKVVRKKGSGRKRKHTVGAIKEVVKAVPLTNRKRIRSIAKAIKVPRSTLHRFLKEGVLQRTRSSIKPLLTEANKQARINWVKSQVEEDGRFNDMMDHIDEKWFYITVENERYIIVEGESIPQRQCKSKRYITKVMFLAAFARPRIVDYPLRREAEEEPTMDGRLVDKYLRIIMVEFWRESSHLLLRLLRAL